LDVDETPDKAAPSATVSLEYTMARADLAHAVRTVIRSSRLGGWLYGRAGVAVIGGFSGLFLLGALLSGDVGFEVWLIAACVLLLLLLPELQAVVTLRASQGGRVQRTLLDDDGVRTATAHLDVTMRWQQFQGYRETAKYFDLPLTDTIGRQILVLPKRALDAAGTAQLRDLLATHLTRLER